MSVVHEALFTSFSQLFGREVSNLTVNSIEIPLVQRDYAQGRLGETVKRIRAQFLSALYHAVIPNGKPIGLDFVYGDVEGDKFYPLDGQQRLTTLFLLHWYLSWRAGQQILEQPWTKFSYATRPGARQFCERLTDSQLPSDELLLNKKAKLSSELSDQDWYLYTWKHDPTIQSMLVVIDDLHQLFGDRSREDCFAAWRRLTNDKQPAISFHLLPMKANNLTANLYIKMNSRGKPLTDFENFKAHFESMLTKVHAKKADEFAKKVDTEWADTLWNYRNNENQIDDKFMRYFRFITEVCAWRSEVVIDEQIRIDELAERVYGNGNVRAAENFEFLLQAFDVWHKKNIKAEFESLLTAKTGTEPTPLLLFDAFSMPPNGESPVDLFAACCRLYDLRPWDYACTLLLYSILLNRIHNTPNFPRQLRLLRNLIEASKQGVIRKDLMPALLANVEKIVAGKPINDINSFKLEQVDNECKKAALLQQQPDLQSILYRLEDHDLLRGCLLVFDLNPSIDPKTFAKRADAFCSLFSDKSCWPELTGALLSLGDYSRTIKGRFSELGAPSKSEPWRVLLTESKLPELTKALTNLLDQVAVAVDKMTCLKRIQETFLQQCEEKRALDWRYYFVKYPVMRESQSGRYVGLAGTTGGYSVCMLNKSTMNSNYRDPYLLAIVRFGGVEKNVKDKDLLFQGYEQKPRRMSFSVSGIQIQCVEKGWQFAELPSDPATRHLCDRLFSVHGIDQTGLLAVSQVNQIDTVDRIELGAKLLTDLVKAGL